MLQKMKTSLKGLGVNARQMWVSALAFALTVCVPAGLAMAEGIDDIGTAAKSELDKVLPQVVTVGGSIILIAAGVAVVLVVLRLTRKA